MNSYTSVTLADIAKAANVSVSTVSRILKQREGTIKISEATRERVLAIVKELGYEPNPFASALRTNRTGVLGVLMRDIGDPFLSLLVRTLQRVVHEAGFELLIGHADSNLVTAQSQLHVMASYWFDGLFLLGDVPGDDALMSMLLQRQIPCVALACGAVQQASLVTVDDEQGTKLALEYLYRLGHRRIAFLGDIAHTNVRTRLATLRQCSQQYGMGMGEMNEQYIAPNIGTRSAAAAQVHRLFELAVPPTALFCASDVLALGAFASVWQRGRKVPEDLSIVGFDDIEEASELYPPLTTIRQPVELMARESLALLTTLMERRGEGVETAETRQVIVPAELITRDSCARIEVS